GKGWGVVYGTMLQASGQRRIGLARVASWWSVARYPSAQPSTRLAVAGLSRAESRLAQRELMSTDKPATVQASSHSVRRQMRLVRPAMTVLIVDPDGASAARLANALRPPHQVVVVGSAKEALAQVDRRVP